ncbi:EF-P beta-lysylation protein EpmB [Methylosoma difficile]
MPKPSPATPHIAKNWQQQLTEAFTSIGQLCSYLHLNINELPVSEAAAKDFAIKVPLSFAECMEKGNANDPLLRQVLPIDDEMVAYPGFSNDPVGDIAASPHTGILHKYQGRVLLINTGSCAINCRYCFRRHFPYADLQLSKQAEEAALAYINNNASISEVILSGGDPLLLSDSRLARLFEQLNAIPHLKRIRIHSRLPIVLPARVTDGLVATLKQSPKKTVLVVHCNHGNELNGHVHQACQALLAAGITLFNQSVLLKGVNDDAAILGELSEKLFAIGVIPYYLHLLDKASGTGHFDVGEKDALTIMAQLEAALPGYLVPKLVKEQAGAASKTRVG